MLPRPNAKSRDGCSSRFASRKCLLFHNGIGSCTGIYARSSITASMSPSLLRAHLPSIYLYWQYLNMVATTIVLSALVGSALAVAEPTVTAAPRLHPRQSDVDPALVGYMSASDGCKSSVGPIKYRSLTPWQTKMVALATTLKPCPPLDPSPNAVLLLAPVPSTQHAHLIRFWPPRPVVYPVMPTLDWHAIRLC
jgi:hypothetical protein